MRNNNLTSIFSYSLLKCDKSSKYRMKCVFFDCYFGHFFVQKKILQYKNICIFAIGIQKMLFVAKRQIL